MLDIQSLTFTYDDGLTPFESLDLKVGEGEVIALVGPSGIGKSTLLKCISGFLQPKQGKILFEGERVEGPHEKLLPGHDDIALVNQDFQLDIYHTAEENVRNILLHLSKEDRDEFVNELIDLVDLSSRRQTQALFLSGGEKQRLALARAIAKEPKLLLLDEPFSHLDIHLRRKVGQYIKELAKLRKTSIILVTHEGEEALSWAQSIYFFNRKRVVELGTPDEVYKNPKDEFTASFFGEVNLIQKEGELFHFRPNQFLLNKEEGKEKLKLSFIRSEFRGVYYANYFKVAKDNEIVLYHTSSLSQLKKCYV